MQKKLWFTDAAEPAESPLGHRVADYARLLTRCLKRVCSWRVPPNWSAVDWLDEMQALAEAAAFHAECEFDSLRGVPIEAFIYQRIVARAFTRYRQEWSYALRCLPEERATTGHFDEDNAEELPCPANSYAYSNELDDPEWLGNRLRAALEYLPGSDRDLLMLLFWEGHTESEIAGHFGISQPAVNKRKRAVLHQLKDWLKTG
jgi:DNA-directed RNA polymerase specialized sigma24 family protein